METNELRQILYKSKPTWDYGSVDLYWDDQLFLESDPEGDPVDSEWRAWIDQKLMPAIESREKLAYEQGVRDCSSAVKERIEEISAAQQEVITDIRKGKSRESIYENQAMQDGFEIIYSDINDITEKLLKGKDQLTSKEV